MEGVATILINLKHFYLQLGKAAQVGKLPEVTRSISTKILVN